LISLAKNKPVPLFCFFAWQAAAIAPLPGLRLAARVPEALLEQILQDIEALFATAAGKESVPG